MAQLFKVQILLLTPLYQCWISPSFVVKSLKNLGGGGGGGEGREGWFFRWKIDFLFCVKSFVQDCRLQIGALTSSLKSNKRSVTKMPLSRHFDLLFLKKKFYENVWISLSTSAGRKEPLFYEASPSGGFLIELDIDLFLKYIWACNKRPLSWNFELLL